MRVRSLVRIGLASGLVLGFSLLAGGSSASAAEAVPYKDPNASGSITLCDKDLQPITEGSVADLPFVWRAVGSEEAPAPYNGDPMRAILYAAQPRQGVPPAGWTSNILTAASIYQVQASPMAQSTMYDFPLWVNLDQYPARLDGFIQLRLYYSTVNAPMSTVYAATNIQVTGNTWHAIDAGNSSCGASSDALSVETLLPNFNKRVEQHVKQFGPDSKKAQKFTGGSGSTDNPTASSSVSPDPDASGEAAPPGGPSDSTGGSSGPSRNWTSIAVLGAFALAVGAAAMVWRRQAGRS